MNLLYMKKYTFSSFVLLLSVLLVMGFSTSCSAHEIGGKSASDIFNNEAAIMVANDICSGNKSEYELSDNLAVNEQGFDGFTLLMWAMSCDNKNAVKKLLSNGADVNLAMESGVTAMIQASGNSDDYYLKILLSNGGDASAGLGRGHTHSALGRSTALGVYEGDWDNFDALIAAGANINSDHPLRHEYTIGEYLINVYGAFCKVQELVEDKTISTTVGLKYALKNRSAGIRESNQMCRNQLLNRFEK